MKNYIVKTILAAIFATTCCVNTFADDPRIPYDVPTAWNYQQNNWMKQIPNSTPLNKISMVSSHDAGMDKNTYPKPGIFWATQQHDIYEQAAHGVRFFDLRIQDTHGDYFAYHGDGILMERGMLLSYMFDCAVRFLEDNDSEVLIFKLSHWYSEGEMKAILNYINNHDKWTSRLYKANNDYTQPPILNEVSLGNVRGKLILVVDDTIPASEIKEDARENRLAKEFGFTPSKGFWQFGDLADHSAGRYGFFRLYDSYSDSSNYETMRNDQIEKFEFFLHGGFSNKTDAFLYCWQLTYSFSSLTSISSLAEKCNPHLASDLNTLIHERGGKRPNLVNLDFIDDRICNIVINTNAELCTQNPVTYLSTRDDGTSSHGVIEEYKVQSLYYTVTGDFYSEYNFTNGWYVIEGDVNMKKGGRVSGEDVNIILKDGCHLTITTDEQAPGIRIEESRFNLHIYAQSNSEAMGMMKVTGGAYCAAIGGVHDGWNINIHGGHILAYGGTQAAAIGGGVQGNGKNISIFGGEVKAESNRGGAAIGGGIGAGGGGNGENIKIYGGKVSVQSIDQDGTTGGAGIGGGMCGNGKDIYVYGGNINAWGSANSAGIGGGRNGNLGGGIGENIQIHGGKIDALGGVAIGGASCKDIYIYGGTIRAYSDAFGYSIGAINGYASNIVIRGGSVLDYSESGIDYPTDGNSRKVYEVTVPECKSDGGPMELLGISWYGSKDLYQYDRKLHLWLPNGSYDFSLGENMYHADVYNQAVEATIIGTAIEVVVGPSGYSSIYSDKQLIVPAGVKVYAYVEKEGAEEPIPVLIGENEVLPANQGYIIKADAGTYRFFTSSKAPVSIKSVLTGTSAPKPIEEFYPGKEKYGLGKLNGKTAFYKYTDTWIKSGKAYLIK